MRIEDGVIQETVETGKAPSVCPKCGSEWIDYASFDEEFGETEATQPARCETCDFQWVDVYTFCCSEVAQD